MDLDEFFKSDTPAPVVMNGNEFYLKAHKVISTLLNSYTQAWQNRALKDDEYPAESICDKCTGCGVFKDSAEKELECFQDRVQGECYHRFCDYELVCEELEQEIGDMFELINVEKIT